MLFHKCVNAAMGLGLFAYSACASAVMVDVADCCGLSDQGGISVIKAHNAYGATIGKSSISLVQPDLAENSNIVYESVEFVDDYSYQIVQLDNLELGSYQLTLTDFEFPDPLAKVGVNLVTATASIADLILSDNGQLQKSILFDISAEDSYYLSMFGRSNSIAALGLYGVELKMISPVPLPLSAVYLGSGLVLLWLRKRRRFIR